MRKSFFAAAMITATVFVGLETTEAEAGGGGAYLVVPVRDISYAPTIRRSGFNYGPRAPYGVTMGRGRALGYGFQTTNLGQNRRYQNQGRYQNRGRYQNQGRYSNQRHNHYNAQQNGRPPRGNDNRRW